jgi:hypothetical protein
MKAPSTLLVDIATLPADISQSIERCLAVHGIVLPPDVLREVGRNVAGSVVLKGEDAAEFAAMERAA